MAADAEHADCLRALHGSGGDGSGAGAGGDGGGGSHSDALAALLAQVSLLPSLEEGVRVLSARVAAVELAHEAGVNPPRTPPRPALAPPNAPAHPAPTTVEAPALADAIASGIAKVLRHQEGAAKDYSATILDDRCSDAQAINLASLEEPLDSSSGRPAPAATSPPLSDWRRGDSRQTGRPAAGSRWSPRRSTSPSSVPGAAACTTSCRRLVPPPPTLTSRRCRPWSCGPRFIFSSWAELCACRYDVINLDDPDLAAEIEDRILAPADQHASKSLAGVFDDERREWKKATAKQFSAQRRTTRGGGNGKRNEDAGPGPAAGR